MAGGPVTYTDDAGNVLTTPAHIMSAAMMTLACDPVACQPGVIMRSLDDQFTQRGTKMGRRIWMRLKQYFEVTEGKTYKAQPLEEEVIPIDLNKQANVGFEWDSFTQYTHIQDVMEREVAEALKGLVNYMDNQAMNFIGDPISRYIGTLGQDPGEGDAAAQSAYKAYARGAKNLLSLGIPTPLHAIVSPFQDLDLLIDSMNLYNPQGQVGQNYLSGQFAGGNGRRARGGINFWYQSGNPYANTIGDIGGSTPLLAGANQTGDSLSSDGWAASKLVLRRGNIIGFGAPGILYETNPQPPHRTFGQQFTVAVTEDVRSSATGTATIPVWPKVRPPRMNANNEPIERGWNVHRATVDNTPITIYGVGASGFAGIANKEYLMGTVFHQKQGVLVMCDLPTYRGTDIMQRVRSRKAGVACRYARDWESRDDEAVSRMDIGFGGAPYGTGRAMGYVVLGKATGAVSAAA